MCTGLIEIKCPHCKKDTTINEAAEDNKFCLKEISGVLQLNQNHPYYFQVQQQLHVCKDIMECKYTDFVVWTKKEIFIQRILPDSKFWAENLEKLEQFWDICILPEIVGKFYTNLNNETSQSVLKQVPENTESPYKSNDKDLWCSCRGTESEWLDATIKIVNGSGFILIVLVLKGNPNQIYGIVQTVESYHNLRPLKIGSKQNVLCEISLKYYTIFLQTNYLACCPVFLQPNLIIYVLLKN